MITLEDCLAFCGLTEAEVLAIAEHEHIPEAAAAGLAQYLMTCPGGPQRVREIILDDIRNARHNGHREHARELVMVLRHFLECHPEARLAPLAPRPDDHGGPRPQPSVRRKSS
jgi:hypothetical protein